jgi:MYXO-CTERM domain-containing protein
MHRSTRALFARAGLLAAAIALAPAAPAGALPLISELFYDAVGSDDGQSFVELYGAAGSSLDGLLLELVNGDGGSVATRLTLAGSFGADGFFVVADRTAAGTTSVADADLLLDFDLQNGPDSLVLRGASGVLDAVGFGVFDAGQVFAGEGAPAVDPPAGSSIARAFANADLGDNAIDFVALAVPTPGQGPLAQIPEPGTAALGALGLAALGAGRGRR